MYSPSRGGPFDRTGVDGGDPLGHTVAVTIAIASLHVYPIKGAAGFSPARWAIEERGLRHDRRFMVVDEKGSLVTQRELPALARVQATIENATLMICANGATARCPVAPTEGEAIRTTVWEDEVDAIMPSREADDVLSDALGVRCRLAFQPDGSARLTAEKRGLPQRRYGLADAAPVLVVALSAVDDLNARLASASLPPVGADRFRGNILLSGVDVGDDDRWSSMTVGAPRTVGLRLATRCRRCKVVCIDQSTGNPTGAEPLRMLGSYRRESDGEGIVFGRHAIVDGEGTLGVGDPVSVG